MDYDAATVFGLMEAMDVPMSESNVVTFWEGEVAYLALVFFIAICPELFQ